MCCCDNEICKFDFFIFSRALFPRLHFSQFCEVRFEVHEGKLRRGAFPSQGALSIPHSFWEWDQTSVIYLHWLLTGGLRT